MNFRLYLKKNLLDANLQKYLQIVSGSIIILFTYIIGIFIAYVTGQLDINNFFTLSVLIITTLLVFGTFYLIFKHSRNKIRKILKDLATLEKI